MTLKETALRTLMGLGLYPHINYTYSPFKIIEFNALMDRIETVVATSDRPGLFEAASSGTLVLDEIGEISPGMQIKLLRVLQEKEILPIGGSKGKKVDVRMIAASHLPQILSSLLAVVLAWMGY